MDHVRLTCREIEELAGLYVLDALEPADMIAVSAHLGTCPESHALFAELAATSSELSATIDPVAMPPAMKDRVMAAVASTPQVPDGAAPLASAPAAHTPPPAMAPVPPPMMAPSPPPGMAPAPPPPGMAPAPPPPPMMAPSPPPAMAPPPPRAEPVERSSWLDRLRGGTAGGRDGWARSGMAAGMLAIVLVGVGIIGAFQLASNETDRLGLLRDAVVAAASDDANVAVLGGENAEGLVGYAVFPDDDDGFIVIEGLEQPAADKAYQAWFLADGVPESAGLLTVDDGLGTLTGLDPDAGTTVIAVTIEDAPGVEAPTSDPILAGELRAATASWGTWPLL